MEIFKKSKKNGNLQKIQKMEIFKKSKKWESSKNTKIGNLQEMQENGNLQKNGNFKKKIQPQFFLDRLGGAKADRRKEAAIALSVENFLTTEHADQDDGRMSRAKMVKFFNHCFPKFLQIVINVVRNEKIVDFSKNSVFQKSSRIPHID